MTNPCFRKWSQCCLAIATPGVDEAFVSHKIGATVKDIGQATGADAAIDFNFADTDNGVPIGRVIVEGKTVNSDSPKTKARDELYMLPDGAWHIGKAPANAVHAVQGSPHILMDGTSSTTESVKRDQLSDSSWKGKNYRVTGLRLTVGLYRPRERSTRSMWTHERELCSHRAVRMQ
ncbi:hypothetical protein PAT3040_06126 [Paenibacillus agaridevorans]|uniref:Uncharacterized protein n=1 Tax=Paenibacillus agaridevorans TaxID=171404 RepID=A0A2R5EYY2_9BACL|nr:hypothetical protein PAT3040_06126 [Paenibacillus agaridevorans]